jgi:hypothetical protein
VLVGVDVWLGDDVLVGVDVVVGVPVFEVVGVAVAVAVLGLVDVGVAVAGAGVAVAVEVGGSAAPHLLPRSPKTPSSEPSWPLLLVQTTVKSPSLSIVAAGPFCSNSAWELI